MAGIRKKSPCYLQKAHTSQWSMLRNLSRRLGILPGYRLYYIYLAKGTVYMCLAQQTSSMVLDSVLSTLFKRQSF